MGRLNIDFNASRFFHWYFSAAPICFVAALMLWWRGDLLAQRDVLVTENAKPIRSLSAEPPPNAEADKELRKISSSLRYPWGAVWGALQQVQGTTVTLHLEPSTNGSKMWRLTIQAPDSISMLDFLRRLESVPALRSVVLEGEVQQVAAAGGAGEGVVFQLVVEWADEA